jgi:hypothetical protein
MAGRRDWACKHRQNTRALRSSIDRELRLFGSWIFCRSFDGSNRRLAEDDCIGIILGGGWKKRNLTVSSPPFKGSNFEILHCIEVLYFIILMDGSS